MSTITKPNQHLPSSESTTKKKFGKNLNKLTKPPPPSSANAASKANSNSRNGLLLLSTKRQSSNQNTASAGGILASKSSQGTTKPLPSLGLQNQSSTSTHDALLGAVVGASRVETQQPDAWGVADKKKDSIDETEQTSRPEPTRSETRTPSGVEAEVTSQARTAAPQTKDPSSSSWDEYGGRNLSRNGTGQLFDADAGRKDDDKKVTMARMARDRAEQRRVEEEARQSDQHQRANQRLRELEEKMGAADESSRFSSKPRTLYDPNAPRNSGTTKDEMGTPGENVPDPNAFSRQPMIQLSSYDDRDRGQRGGNSGPRMLFDPKSGSMVAVPSRDEPSSNGRGRKERGKKGRSGREKEFRAESKQENESSRSGRKGKRDKKVSSDSTSPAKSESRRGKMSGERRLPRTCGVLYARDKKGNFSCKDGCDGDLGYGAHSVPGGRVKNNKAYALYVQDEKQSRVDEGTAYSKKRINSTYAKAVTKQNGNEHIELQTGFSLPSVPEVKFDWVKPSDKIELITGIDDSPTLQATAKAWAPSQAALAAAARVDTTVGDNVIPTNSSMDEHDNQEDDGDFGLGFDPTLNMDSVVQSPGVAPSNGLGTMDLTTLSLEPSFQPTANTNHIFAFGTGATWGASDPSGGNDNWSVPAASGTPASFLSLSSGNAWGGVPGFGGSSLNGDHSRSPGD